MTEKSLFLFSILYLFMQLSVYCHESSICNYYLDTNYITGFVCIDYKQKINNQESYNDKVIIFYYD